MRFVDNKLDNKLLFVLALKSHINRVHQRLVVSYDILIYDLPWSFNTIFTRQLVLKAKDCSS